MAAEYYDVHVPGECLYNLSETIKIRKITPIEQKRLLTLFEGDDTTTKDILTFINSMITGIDPNELYWPDYYYVLYHMRVISYSRFPLEVKFTCPKCGNEEKVEIAIDKLDTVSVPEFLLNHQTIKLENFGEVPFRYKKVKDDVMVDDFMKSHKLELTDWNIRSLINELCLLTEWKPLEELWTLAESGEITIQDTILIEEYFEKSTWGVKEEVAYTCQKCHEEVSNAYNMQLENFFPSSFSH